MDTITHGIAGALIGKAFCGGDSMFPVKPVGRARITTWTLMLGSIFPDSDVFRDMLSSNPLLIITWHRSYTHSLLMLPLFAPALAGITRWLAKKFGWEFIVCCAHRTLRDRNCQPHSDGPGDDIRHDGLVALVVVAPGLGSGFHRRLYDDGHSADSAVARVGSPRRRAARQAPRGDDVDAIHPRDVRHRSSRKNCWRAYFQRCDLGSDWNLFGLVSASGYLRLGIRSCGWLPGTARVFSVPAFTWP